MELTKEEIERLNEQEFRELAAKINEQTKWKCLEARALFYQRLANAQMPRINNTRNMVNRK